MPNCKKHDFYNKSQIHIFQPTNLTTHGYWPMSTIIKGVIIAFILLTLVDSGFMIKYLITQASVISQASFARLVTFVLTHFYFAFMLGVLYQTDHSSLEDIQIYRYSEWLVNAFVPIAVIDTLIEIMLFVLLGSQKMVSDRNVPPELK